MLVCIADHVPEAIHHDFFQAAVDQLLVPEISLPVLHPFEIGNGDAAGVGENVREDDDATAREDFIGVRRGGAVGGFGDDAGLYA